MNQILKFSYCRVLILFFTGSVNLVDFNTIFSDQLLHLILTCLKKFQLYVSFYSLFISRLVFENLTKKTFVWKSANYADTY